jgi:hypothetical protein
MNDTDRPPLPPLVEVAPGRWRVLRPVTEPARSDLPMPHVDKNALPCLAVPDLALPGPAVPGHTLPRLAEPRRAWPRHALRRDEL